MKVFDDRIWYSNTDKSITDVSQLDPAIYKSVFTLMNNGATVEIGPGVPPEHGNGIYIKGLTEKQIRDIFHQDFLKKQALNNQTEILEIKDETNIKELSPEEEILNRLCELGKNYATVQIHASIGFNMEDIVDSVFDVYEAEILPKIQELSSNEKEKLLGMINDKLQNLPIEISSKFLIHVRDIINNEIEENSTEVGKVK